ncbi:MAG: hypothetical protein M3307_00005 [Thermoproteota archaeon]|nr:hypothetical protein [Thermoproteota archaeon]MDQ3726606.1 hypothetical protein [Thermoproteota archaeon]
MGFEAETDLIIWNALCGCAAAADSRQSLKTAADRRRVRRRADVIYLTNL